MSTLFVGQHEFAFTNGEKMATFHVKTCLCIVAYNEITKKTLMMHVDNCTDDECVRQILSRMKDSRITLIGSPDFEHHYLVEYIRAQYKVVEDFSYVKDGKNVLVDNGKITITNFSQNIKDEDKIDVDCQNVEVKVLLIDKNDDLIVHSKYNENVKKLLESLETDKKRTPLFGIEGYDDEFQLLEDDDIDQELELKLMRLRYLMKIRTSSSHGLQEYLKNRLTDSVNAINLQNQTRDVSAKSSTSKLDSRSEKAKEYEAKKALEKELKSGSIETPTQARLRKKLEKRNKQKIEEVD
jgi:hypothetical protein